MAKVYVVTRGKYEDYYIDSVFSTREAAEKYCAVDTNEQDEPMIEEYELEDGENIRIEQVYRAISFTTYYIQYRDEYDICFDMMYGIKPFEEKIIRSGKITLRNGKVIETFYGDIPVNKTILEDKEAEKIIYDHIAKWKAEQAGL